MASRAAGAGMSWRCVVLLALTLWIPAGCGAGPVESAAPSEPDPPAAPDDPIPWVTPEARAVNTTRILLESEAAGDTVSFHLYLPDAYHQESERRFPVLVWLHGGGGGVAGIPPLSNLFHGAIARGDIPPLLVVFPNGLPLGMWIDSRDGRQPVETILMDEVLPYVDAEFRTLPPAEGRLVEGWSMGGYGALRLGFAHPGAFAGISALGAGPLQLDFLAEGPRTNVQQRQEILDRVYGGSLGHFADVSPWRLAEGLAQSDPPGPGIPLRIAVGTGDELLGMNREFRDHLAALGVEHRYTEVPEVGHQPLAVLHALGDEYWEFLRDVLQEK